MKKIYICHTLYHIYITLLKEINSDIKSDILISDSIPNYLNIKERIVKSKIFKNIYSIEEENIYIPVFPNINRMIFYYSTIIKSVEKYLPCNLNLYDEVIIYNDFSKLGYYLNAKKIKYILNEDGLDLYQEKNKFATLHFEDSLINKFLELFHLKVLCVGRSRNMKLLEVNDITNLTIKNKNVIQVSRNKLLQSLSESEKIVINKIFLGDNSNIDVYDSEKNIVLILTQPFFVDNLLSNENSQINLYKNIVVNYTKIDDLIYVKPHPRDTTNYDFLLEYGCKIISKDIPIEVLNFNPNIKFNKAITVTSTSLDGILFVDKKIKLGEEYLYKLK